MVRWAPSGRGHWGRRRAKLVEPGDEVGWAQGESGLGPGAVAAAPSVRAASRDCPEIGEDQGQCLEDEDLDCQQLVVVRDVEATRCAARPLP